MFIIIFKKKIDSYGIILLRIHPQVIEEILFIIRKVILMKIDFKTSFCVVEQKRVRVISLINNNEEKR